MAEVRPAIIHAILTLAIFSPITTAGTRDECSAIVETVGPMKAATSGWTGYSIAVRKPDDSTVFVITDSLRGLAGLVQGDKICIKLVGTKVELKLPKQKTWTHVTLVRYDPPPMPSLR
jgi:hypothetical protein